MTTRFLAYQTALREQNERDTRVLSPWAARALATSDGSRSHAYVSLSDYTLGDRIRADDRQNEPSEREYADLWKDES